MLLSVVVAITLLAAITFMLSYQSVSQTHVASGEFDRDRLRYVAEAGIAHARSQLALNTSCDNYVDIPKTAFAGATYSVTVSPNKGSPVKIKSSVELQHGKKLNINSQDIAAYQPASTVVLQLSETPGKDTILDDFYPIRNYGGASYLQVNSGSWDQRPVLSFDLSKIPADATIQLARLELRQWNANVPGEIMIHRLTRDWVEGTKNGGGIADGATWETHDGSSSWSQPGGEYDPTVYSTRYVTSGGVDGWDQWDVTGLVQEWVSGEIPNYGLLLLGDGTVRNVKWGSRDTNNPLDTPKLTIVYACECGKVCGGTAPGKNVLLVVVDPSILTAQEADKQALIESWGHTVNLIDESASQGEFDAAIANNDVAYVAEEITSSSLGTKLRDAAIGVVIEEQAITDEFGISSGNTTFTESSIDITDNGHYITSPFSLGSIAFADSLQDVGAATGTLAPGLGILALRPSSTMGMLDVIETGGTLHDSGTAAGRRVKLPWGGNNFDINSLTDDGRTIMQRAIEWGAGEGAAAGPLPIAHWKFDETIGTTAIDSEGGHDGTLVGDANWVPGVLDGGLSLDGSGDRVDVSSLVNSPSSLTIAAWVNLSSAGSSGAEVVSLGDNVLLRLDNSFYDTYVAFWDGSSYRRTSSPESIAGSGWRHIAYTHDDAANQQFLYIDGVEVASTTFTTSISYTQASDTTIGAQATGNSSYDFNGQMDDLRIYDVALTAAEIAELATVPAPSGPVAHWKLDETGGTTAVDSVGGHHGTLVNGPVWANGTLGGGLYFDGNNDHMRVDDSADFRLADGTIQAWIHADVTGGEQHLFHKGGNNGLFVLVKDGELTYITAGDTVASPISAGRWYLVTVTFGSKGMKLYLDDSLVASSIKTDGLLDNTDDIYIGSDSFSGKAFNGTIDDIRIYDRVLSDAEIAAIAAEGGSGGSSGTYLDEFTAIAYDGSDGSIDWTSTPWQELGDTDGPSSGRVRVLSASRCASSNCLRIGGTEVSLTGRGVSREANLDDATDAELTFTIAGGGSVTAGLVLSVSNDGGANWTDLETYTIGSGLPSTPMSQSFDISAYISATTQVRFVGSGTPDDTAYAFIDNVRISGTGLTGGGGGGGVGVIFEEFADASLGSDGLSITIPRPAGATAGDLLIAAVVTDGEQKPAMTAPPGWTLIDHDRTSKQVTMDVLWKIAGASEPASYDFSWVKDQEAYGWIMRFTGHDAATPIHQSSNVGGSSSNPQSPAVTTSIDNAMIVRIGGFDDDDITAGDPGLPGHTAITMGSSGTGTGTASGGAGYVLQGAAGSSGTSTFSLNASEEYRAVTIAIAPAP